jgi:hypothetical protein
LSLPFSCCGGEGFLQNGNVQTGREINYRRRRKQNKAKAEAINNSKRGGEAELFVSGCWP